MGIVARSAALPRSPAIRIGRRGRRSTQTPAGSVNRMNGRNSTVPSAATWKADASSTRTAASGNASWETCVPNWLTVSADHSLRKSAWRQRPPVGQIRLAISTPRDSMIQLGVSGDFPQTCTSSTIARSPRCRPQVHRSRTELRAASAGRASPKTLAPALGTFLNTAPGELTTPMGLFRLCLEHHESSALVVRDRVRVVTR